MSKNDKNRMQIEILRGQAEYMIEKSAPVASKKSQVVVGHYRAQAEVSKSSRRSSKSSGFASQASMLLGLATVVLTVLSQS